jgi:hypothetical protein
LAHAWREPLDCDQQDGCGGNDDHWAHLRSSPDLMAQHAKRRVAESANNRCAVALEEPIGIIWRYPAADSGWS